MPPTSRCASDRKLPGNLRYAVLPLSGQIEDATVTDAIELFVKGTPATRNVNALVIQFNVNGGSQQATTALADAILKVRKKMPVIGVFGSTQGPAAVLPVLCDYLIVLNPSKDGTVIDWAPGSDLSDADIMNKIRENMSAITARASDRQFLKAMLAGFTDPTVDLYVWRGNDGCPEAGPVPPQGVNGILLSKGNDSVTGMTGAQLVESGIAIGVQGSLDQIGAALGLKSWTIQAGVGEALLREIKEVCQKDLTTAQGEVKEGFAAIKAARNLVGALIEQESVARASDPRRSSNIGSYSRTWGGRGWSYSSGGTYAWRKNCDTAIDNWNAVLALYQQASGATSRANQLATKLAASPCVKANSDLASDVAALQAEVDAVMAQSGMLTVKGQNAQQNIAWLKANYNNPVR